MVVVVVPVVVGVVPVLLCPTFLSTPRLKEDRRLLGWARLGGVHSKVCLGRCRGVMVDRTRRVGVSFMCKALITQVQVRVRKTVVVILRVQPCTTLKRRTRLPCTRQARRRREQQQQQHIQG